MTRMALLLTVVLLAGAAWAQSGPQVDLADATIADLNVAFNTGTLTAERLTARYLARIAAYDKQGPNINAVISLNPNALSEARALDAERSAGKVRGPLQTRATAPSRPASKRSLRSTIWMPSFTRRPTGRPVFSNLRKRPPRQLHPARRLVVNPRRSSQMRPASPTSSFPRE